MNSHGEKCTLCGSGETVLYHEDRNRTYMKCLNCSLVFVPPEFWLSLEDEKAVYDLHQNNPEDQGYRNFLSQITTPLLRVLKPDAEGLDFGCGPGAALSVIMEEQGYTMDIYDPIYHNIIEVFDKRYDFITTTEVVEHLRNPHEEFSKLFTMLKPGGLLAVMTGMVTGEEAFKKWNYIRDMTHICFYSEEAFEFIADKLNLNLDFPAKSVIFLRKQS